MQSGTSSTTLTRRRSLPFPGGDAFISPVLTAEHAQLEPLPFPLHRVSPPRDEYVPPAAPTPPSPFQRHASADVWMAGVVFSQIIRMDYLDEGHCKVANYGRTAPAGAPPPRLRAEPMAALLPQDDEWWCLMPPLFSDSTGTSDPAHGSWCVPFTCSLMPCAHPPVHPSGTLLGAHAAHASHGAEPAS